MQKTISKKDRHNAKENTNQTDLREAPETTSLAVAFEKAQQAPKPLAVSRKRREKAVPQKKENKKEVALKEQDASPSAEIFKKLIEARKESEARLKKQEEDHASLLAIRNIGSNTEDIARQITCRRLIAEGGEDRLKAALQLIEEQQAALLSRLGLPPREVPRNSNNSSETHTLSIPGNAARLPEREKEAIHPSRPVSLSQKPAFNKGSMHDLIQSAESYFALYNNEPGHGIRMRHIRQHFRDPARLNEFLAIHEPGEWARQFKYMYDNIIIPPSRYSVETYPAADSIEPEGEDHPQSTEDMIRRNMERMGL